METSIIPTRHGRMRIIDSDPWISRSLRELGEFSESEFGFMRMILESIGSKKPTLEILEAGPYIGDLTLPLSQIVGKIYAFEPQVAIREILLENLEMNGIRNVEVFPYAIGHENGTANYYSEPKEQIHSYGGNQLGIPDGDMVAEMRSLDSLGLRPDFIKADIEGMETQLLLGGQQTLSETRCPLFMEYDTVMLPPECPQLPEILTRFGYNVYPQHFPIYLPNNFNRNPENTFGSTVSKMILALPPISS